MGRRGKRRKLARKLLVELENPPLLAPLPPGVRPLTAKDFESDDDGTVAALFWKQVLKGAHCWVWQGRITADGYGIYAAWLKGST
jgi:hypothetical protein